MNLNNTMSILPIVDVDRSGEGGMGYAGQSGAELGKDQQAEGGGES